MILVIQAWLIALPRRRFGFLIFRPIIFLYVIHRDVGADLFQLGVIAQKIPGE
jgi:hypothetical protein